MVYLIIGYKQKNSSDLFSRRFTLINISELLCEHTLVLLIRTIHTYRCIYFALEHPVLPESIYTIIEEIVKFSIPLTEFLYPAIISQCCQHQMMKMTECASGRKKYKMNSCSSSSRCTHQIFIPSQTPCECLIRNKKKQVDFIKALMEQAYGEIGNTSVPVEFLCLSVMYVFIMCDRCICMTKAANKRDSFPK